MVRFVVMAAGQSTRMGRDKLVLPWQETTVLGYVLRTVQEAIILLEQRLLRDYSPSVGTEIYVVARHPIQTYLTERGIQMFNASRGAWIQVPSPRPLAETIHMGLQDLNHEVQWVGFLPGDQVGITAQKLADILHQILQSAQDFLVPTCGGQAGSPVFFHRQYVSELLGLQGEQGGREVLYLYPERWLRFPVEEAFCQDVDTPEQYHSLKDKLSSDRQQG